MKPEGKNHLEKNKRLYDNIKMGLTDIGLENKDCSHLFLDRQNLQALVSTVMSTCVLKMQVISPISVKSSAF
jgi:hypothetical protein